MKLALTVQQDNGVIQSHEFSEQDIALICSVNRMTQELLGNREDYGVLSLASALMASCTSVEPMLRRALDTDLVDSSPALQWLRELNETVKAILAEEQ